MFKVVMLAAALTLLPVGVAAQDDETITGLQELSAISTMTAPIFVDAIADAPGARVDLAVVRERLAAFDTEAECLWPMWARQTVALETMDAAIGFAIDLDYGRSIALSEMAFEVLTGFDVNAAIVACS